MKRKVGRPKGSKSKTTKRAATDKVLELFEQVKAQVAAQNASRLLVVCGTAEDVTSFFKGDRY